MLQLIVLLILMVLALVALAGIHNTSQEKIDVRT